MSEELEPDDRSLPVRRVTPDQFRVAARKAGWQQKSVDLFLTGRPLDEPVAVGEKPDRALLLVKW